MIFDRNDKPSGTVELYRIFRAYVVHEDDLINQRISWFIQLHSFLIATYGIVFAAVLQALSSDKIPLVWPIVSQPIACILLSAISVVGIMSSRAARESIEAAHKAINQLKRDWECIAQRRSDAEGLPGLIGGGDPTNDLLGASLHSNLPRRLLGLWKWSFLIPVAFLALSGWSTYLVKDATRRTSPIVAGSAAPTAGQTSADDGQSRPDHGAGPVSHTPGS